MGKFYEALRRSGTLKEPPPKATVTSVVKLPTDTVKGYARDPDFREVPVDSSLLAMGIDPRLTALLDPSSAASECYKMLRTKLLVLSRERPLRSILVTSAEPLDGKSLASSNLAVSIAQGINDYVLLVDCDIRSPSIARVFNLNVQAGIEEYLKGDAPTVEPFLVKTPLEKLTVLPAGRPSPNPSELLCSTKMRNLIEELKSRYDDRFIIFDSPPGQFTAETAFLARLVDGVLLVVRYGKTPRNLVQETINNVGRDRLLGVIFNASNERQKDYRYYYRYYQKKRKS